MRICILGKSQVFVKIIQELYPNDEIEIIGWRSCLNKCDFFDIIYICGFDKSIYNEPFKKFLYNGYFKQYLFLQRIKRINDDVKIVYVGTKTKSKIIVSRYDFAKNRLAYKLASIGGFYNLQLDFIVGENGLPISKYGLMYSFCFLLLKKFDLIQVCNLSSIKIKLQSVKFERTFPMDFKRLFLKIPRPMIIDKFLKFIFLYVR